MEGPCPAGAEKQPVKIVLTGESAAGKSTALLAVLAVTDLCPEGFVSRRICDAAGRRLYFSHAEGAELQALLKTFRIRYTRAERRRMIEDFYAGKAEQARQPNAFALWSETILRGRAAAGERLCDTAADRRTFTAVLRRWAEAASQDENKLWVADEMGGLELADDYLFGALTALADSPNHLLLVLKSRSHLEQMGRRRGLGAAEMNVLLARHEALEESLQAKSQWIDCSEVKSGRRRAELVAAVAARLESGLGE